MARPIDADAVKFSISGLRYIDHNDYFALAEYFMKQVKAMPTLTPPNEPLTLEQLREMDGVPVHVPETNCWALVTQNAFCPMLTFSDGEKCSVYDWYEQVGPVYRRPPEGEDDT